ncbi:MAG: hypothetical protein HY246_05845, partial [Proteobacteria bacterium]|nr:hypothetical protein [Pseudomonadota bacterium]
QVQPDVPLAPPIAAPPADTARPAARVPAPRKSRPEPTTERLRGPEVRSVRLGMRLDEFKAALDGEIAEWRQSWRVENESDPYLRRQVNVRLADRSLLEAEFVSAIDGAELYVVSYQQVLRDGPTPDELIQALEAKYGKPDAINHPQGSTAYRSTYDLPSRAQHVLGAFMKVYFDFERAESGGRARVENFRIVINDAGFGAFDETAIYEHRRAAERRAYETNKSGAPKF